MNFIENIIKTSFFFTYQLKKLTIYYTYKKVYSSLTSIYVLVIQISFSFRSTKTPFCYRFSNDLNDPRYNMERNNNDKNYSSIFGRHSHIIPFKYRVNIRCTVPRVCLLRFYERIYYVPYTNLAVPPQI